MKTNQDKAKELIGEEAYNLLIENGFFPIEMENLKVFLDHQKQIERLDLMVSVLEEDNQPRTFN